VELLKKFIDRFDLDIVYGGEQITFDNAVRILEGELPEKKTIEQRKQYLISTMKPYTGMYSSDMLNKFYRYWTATDGHKLKFEKQKTWDIELRLANWKRNEEEFERQRYINNLKNRL
jgi:predicted phosphoadenosine phosphosulfate sulfurtransferase